MPQEFDSATGNLVTQHSARTDAVAPVVYRSAVAAADGTTKPAAGSALWLANPGYRQEAQVFVTATGSPALVTLRPYLRAGGASGSVATLDAVTLNGTPNYDASFDVRAQGRDLAVLVEALAGGTAPAVSIAVGWG